MSRPRKRSRRRPRAARPAPPAPAVTVTPPGAEERLLELARSLAGIPQQAADPRNALAASIEHLARAWQPDSPLPASVFETWRDVRADETRALSISFAREQIRLGLHEIFEAALKGGHLRDDLSVDDLAWLVTAACESLAHGGDRAERVRTLVSFCVAQHGHGVASR